MASYTTPDKIRAVLDPLDTGDAGSAAALEDPILQGAADRASSEVNARLGSRYTVPIAEPWPDVLVTIATDLAAYDATLSHYQSVDITDEDPVVRRYRNSRFLLLDIAAGKADLYPGAGGVDPIGSGGTAQAAVINPYQGKLFGLEDFGLGYGRCGPGRWPDGW